MVSKARLDLPDPERPVMTMKRSRGSLREMSLRLCSRAPTMTISLAPMCWWILPPGADGNGSAAPRPRHAGHADPVGQDSSRSMNHRPADRRRREPETALPMVSTSEQINQAAPTNKKNMSWYAYRVVGMKACLLYTS